MCDVSKKTILVCDLDDPKCKQAAEAVKRGGFELRIVNVREYRGLDNSSPQLYAGQLAYSGIEQIENFVTRFGPAYDK